MAGAPAERSRMSGDPLSLEGRGVGRQGSVRFPMWGDDQLGPTRHRVAAVADRLTLLEGDDDRRLWISAVEPALHIERPTALDPRADRAHDDDLVGTERLYRRLERSAAGQRRGRSEEDEEAAPRQSGDSLKALFMQWVPRSAFARGDRFSLDLELDVGKSVSRSLSV